MRSAEHSRPHDGFSAWVPIPNGRGRPRAAPFGVGPWDGARVASQQGPTLRPGQRHCSKGQYPPETDQNKKEREKIVSAGCSIGVALWQLEIPSVGANSSRSVDAGFGEKSPSQAARRSVWSGPDGEEFAPDKSASAEADDQAELPASIASSTSRRNVLGAIAYGKERLQLPVATTTETNPERLRAVIRENAHD
jgi:hypothetical protein